MGNIIFYLFMTHKEIVREMNRGFELNDPQLIAKHIADDVVWHVLGAYTAHGKDEYLQNIRNEGFIGNPIITTKNEISEGDHLAVEGEVETTLKSGQVIHLSFHNTYRFENDKVKAQTSYLVPKQ